MTVHMTDDEDSLRPLRRQMDNQYIERLTRMEVSLLDLEKRVEKELGSLTKKVDDQKDVLVSLSQNNKELMERQKSHEPVFDSLVSIVKVSVILKWIIVAIMGGLGAMATILSIVDYFNKKGG